MFFFKTDPLDPHRQSQFLTPTVGQFFMTPLIPLGPCTRMIAGKKGMSFIKGCVVKWLESKTAKC